jgi:hypothetical protein
LGYKTTVIKSDGKWIVELFMVTYSLCHVDFDMEGSCVVENETVCKNGGYINL